MNEKFEVLRIRITEEMKARFFALSAAKGFNMSEYLRYIVMRDLENNEEWLNQRLAIQPEEPKKAHKKKPGQ